MECHRCERVALYVVENKGYCKLHRDQAFTHASQVNSRHESLKMAYIHEYRNVGSCKRHYK